MKTNFKVSLKANDRIYINGAVVRVDRKTSLEFLNDVDFLLEHNILQADQADTPLKQLYYLIQIMLMSPNDIESSFIIYKVHMPELLSAFNASKVKTVLKNTDQLVHEKKYFEAMKLVRGLFSVEAEILSPKSNALLTIERGGRQQIVAAG